MRRRRLSSEEGRFVRCPPMVSWRAHFVLREPMEDDHDAKPVPTRACRDRCGRVDVADRGLCRVRRGRARRPMPPAQSHSSTSSATTTPQFPVTVRDCERHRHDREPADGDRVALADGNRDAVRDRCRRQVKAVDKNSDYPAVPRRTPRSTVLDLNAEAVAELPSRPGRRCPASLPAQAGAAEGVGDRRDRRAGRREPRPGATSSSPSSGQVDRPPRTARHAGVDDMKTRHRRSIVEDHAGRARDVLLRARPDLLLRSPRRPSSVRCSDCSACTASPTPRRGPRPAADIRSCPRVHRQAPTRITSSWPTRSAASSRAATVAARPGWSVLAAVQRDRVVASTTTSPHDGARGSSTCCAPCRRVIRQHPAGDTR